tara:strand:+ start:2471 stop:3196 length:726 start_codon:yes stop_codon:yes gene_type:complete
MFDTYVMHCERLTERRDHIEKTLRNMDIYNYHLITNEMDNDSCSYGGFYEDNKLKAREYAQVWLDKHPDATYNHQKLSAASISLCWKWHNALKRFVDSSENNYGLFLEDDCYFDESISKGDIELIINNAGTAKSPIDDIIFLGGAFGHNIINWISQLPVRDSLIKGFLIADHPSTNTTSSLIIKKSAAKKILDVLCPFYLPIDWQFNHIFYQLKLSVLHTYPYICSQLSAKKDGFISEVKR